MKFQFQIDGRPAGPIRRTWDAAAHDAVSAGYAVYVIEGIKLDPQAHLERIEDANAH